MELTFKEKSLIASLVITLLVFGHYFVQTFSHLYVNPEVTLGSRQIINAIILVVILEAISHSFIASTDKLADDERGRLIEKLAYKNSYWCLCIGVWLLIGHLLFKAWFMESVRDLSPYFLGNLLLLFFVLSETIHFVTQLYYYRRGDLT